VQVDRDVPRQVERRVQSRVGIVENVEELDEFAAKHGVRPQPSASLVEVVALLGDSQPSRSIASMRCWRGGQVDRRGMNVVPQDRPVEARAFGVVDVTEAVNRAKAFVPARAERRDHEPASRRNRVHERSAAR
jgi:hypothetical protein